MNLTTEMTQDQSFHTFYCSNLYTEIRNGISDMHCRADGYLAEELQLEVDRKIYLAIDTLIFFMILCTIFSMKDGKQHYAILFFEQKRTVSWK